MTGVEYYPPAYYGRLASRLSRLLLTQNIRPAPHLRLTQSLTQSLIQSLIPSLTQSLPQRLGCASPRAMPRHDQVRKAPKLVRQAAMRHPEMLQAPCVHLIVHSPCMYRAHNHAHTGIPPLTTHPPPSLTPYPHLQPQPSHSNPNPSRRCGGTAPPSSTSFLPTVTPSRAARSARSWRTSRDASRRTWPLGARRDARRAGQWVARRAARREARRAARRAARQVAQRW